MPPVIQPIGGMITSLTSELTILPNAPPITIPTAMSITLPRIANAFEFLQHAHAFLLRVCQMAHGL
ncbi:hypothetical protein RLIN73S_05853 [Rhodanobacter lindaniclasticus]